MGMSPITPGIRYIRLIFTLLALPALLGLSAVFAAAPASADVSTFAAAVNAERGQRGLAPLAVAGDLNAVAQAWSQNMASSGSLAHNPNLSGQVSGGWRMIGENVGYGGSELSVHNALMASAPHRANILNTGYTQVGIGIARGYGSTWVTQVFRQPAPGFVVAPTSYQKSGYSPVIYAVSGSTHRPIGFAEWAAAGYPKPTATNTWYVRYPWSARVFGVTFWADGWQWDRLDYPSWVAAGGPTPRTAGWVSGSTIWKNSGSDALYITDPDGWSHHLTFAEWAAAEYRAPQVR